MSELEHAMSFFGWSLTTIGLILMGWLGWILAGSLFGEKEKDE